MKVSELSRRSGVRVPLIKYYLREGLLPAGRATAANQADYGEEHVHRLRLIRTLIAVRGLSVGATKEILNAVSAEQGDLHQVFGIVLGLRPAKEEEEAGDAADADRGSEEPEPPGLADALKLIADMGWEVSHGAPAARALGQVLASLADLDADLDWRSLLPYARLADSIADVDVEQMRGERDVLAQAERAVLVSILLEPALLALRRLAQEAKSAQGFGG